MKEMLKRFWYEEDGMGVIEIVIIIAVLVGVALIFKDTLTDYAQKLMQNLFDPDVDVSTNSTTNSALNK